ncbi:MAG: hypothetical protein FWG84_08335 [Bacteroidales bacterium]|nr:hypothetical protein [Bacteroidales bacterium]
MDKKIILIAKIVAFALVAVALIFLILLLVNPTSDAVIGNYLTVAYITFGIAVVTALIFPIVHMISNPKGAVKAFLGVVAILVLGLISYLFATNEFTAIQLEKLQITESASIWVGAGLNLTFIVGIVTILAAIFLAIRGSILK